MDSITGSAAWKALVAEASSGPIDLRIAFASDPDRASRLTMTAGDLTVDLSKHLVDAITIERLVAVAEAAGLPQRIAAMFDGERINSTEHRAVLHAALRAAPEDAFSVDGHDVVAGVHEVLDRMAGFSQRVRQGEWVGHTGERIRSVVNIGIGGSDLGPAMAYRALRSFVHADIEAHFVSNIDPAHLAAVLDRVRPESTLFIVASMSACTNDRSAR